MASLHEALHALGPTTWDEIPKSQGDLRAYLHSLAQQARTIIASVPEPPPSSSPSSSHDSHVHPHTYQHTYTVTPSPARLGTTDPEVLSLQRQWGKPLKPGHARDNPHEIPLYKLQATDGKATWFGRRSVHAGMPFERWRGKMGAEMEETLRLNEGRVGKGLAPDRVVRGLGAARKVEDVEVWDSGDVGGSGRVIGGVRVYEICAHFPKPTTARDFVQVSVSWEDGVETPEHGDGGEGEGKGRRCRSWLSISKPCVHPELPPQEGYIRGQYDSLEFIREVPPVALGEGDGKGAGLSDPNLVQHEGISESAEETKKDKKGRKRGKMDTATDEKHSEHTVDGIVEDNETNPYPVEWIMVTRSDPGGSIPRWVIEKGTPKSIWADTIKFIDWACRDDDKGGSKPSSSRSSIAKGPDEDKNLGNEDADENAQDGIHEIHEQEQRNGLIANFAYLLNAGLERYAPQAILDYVPYQQHRFSTNLSSESSDEEFNDALSTASSRPKTRGETGSQTSQKDGSDSGHNNIAPVDLMQMDKKTEKLTSHEKHLAKLAQRKRDVQAKLETVRTEIEVLRLDAGANAGVPGDDEKDKEKDKKEEKEEREREKREEKERKEKQKQEEKERKEKEKQEKKEKRKSKKDKEESHDPPKPDPTADPNPKDSDSKSTTTTSNRQPSSETSDKQRPKHTRTASTTSHRSAAQIHKAASGLFAQESKLLKQLGKIEQDQLKEASKIEARQKKQAEREEKSRSRMEVDGLKTEVDGLRKEVERLRMERQQWMDLVASLQGENQRLGRED